MALEELNVPYTLKYWEFPDLKTPVYEKLCVNGRTPTIEDPNTGVTLWESGAILEYLVEVYDKTNQFTYTSSPEKYQLKQWSVSSPLLPKIEKNISLTRFTNRSYFQASGQGPYFGQKMWFTHFHAEKNITSAIERYGKEIDRVTGVIDKQLSTTGSQYLVGDKYTYADLAFIPWFSTVGWAFPEDSNKVEELNKKYPAYAAWFKRISERPAIKKTMQIKGAKAAEQHK